MENERKEKENNHYHKIVQVYFGYVLVQNNGDFHIIQNEDLDIDENIIEIISLVV